LWPNTPLTTYTFDGAPPIKSMDLNAIQDAINRIINGTYSLKAVTIDGTGGNIVAPAAGSFTVSGTTIFNGDLTIATGHTLNTDSVTFTGGSIGYPTAATSINNLAINGNQCKAWGFAQFDAAGTALSSTDAIGCTTAWTDTLGSPGILITLNDAMTSVAFSATASINNTGVAFQVLVPLVHIQTSSTLIIDIWKSTGAKEFTPGNVELSFAIFGRQT